MEVKGSRRKKRLHWLFITYLVRFCFRSMALAIVIFALFSMLINMGIIKEASAEQNALEQEADKLRSMEYISESDIPEGLSYGVYNSSGTYLYGTFGEDESTKAWEEMEAGKRRASFNEFYRYLHMDSKEICIVRYSMTAKFANPVLKSKLPDAEYLFIGLFLLLFIVQTVWIAVSFGRHLSKRLQTLNQVTERIQNQDLEFGRENSDIAEVDEVLGSLYDMKEALKQSLEEQWREQNHKKEQTKALAHDIKTPLTVIRGSAELIREADALDEAEAYNECILEGAACIENYLSVLQQMLDSGQLEEGEPAAINTQEFIGEVMSQAKMIGQGKRLSIVSQTGEIPGVIIGQEENLLRAVKNVISNAEEYSPIEGKIWITAGMDGSGFLTVTVEDEGPGFSYKDIKEGLNDFYQGDDSRHEKNHYGMGLYIANTFVKQQGGRMVLANSQKHGGASVSIFLKPVKK